MKLSLARQNLSESRYWTEGLRGGFEASGLICIKHITAYRRRILCRQAADLNARGVADHFLERSLTRRKETWIEVDAKQDLPVNATLCRANLPQAAASIP